jgi:regulator of protease activity HflC (stomatin/prohibitin superfamily)
MDGIKELLMYITNQFKFWFIIKEWENGLQLRNGSIVRSMDRGLYFKVPFLDSIYATHKRTQEIVVSQVNFTTKDDKQITASATAFFKIENIHEYYNGYAEPLSIIDGIIKNEMNRYFLLTDYKDFDQVEFERRLLNHLQKITDKGMLFSDFKLTTFSNAKTYRFITDKLYSQVSSYLEDEIH